MYLDTHMPKNHGHVWNVGARGDLQAALNRAQPGDEVVLQAGATYTGNFSLPVKAGASRMPGVGAVIVVRTSAVAALPEGKRVGPADTVSMARLVTPNNAEGIGTAPGTAGWRLVGLEITSAQGLKEVSRLVRFGDGSDLQNTVARIPQNLVLDRSYVHARPSVESRRCIDLHSGASAIIDSYISECHANSDAQAIAGWNGPGPYKILNNYLAASTENVSFGGADPGVVDLVPSDIEIRHNHFYKPVTWKGVWLVKNLFETKSARRVLIEGNVFENNWQHGQGGSAIVLKSTNQAGKCTWCGTSDITFRLNIIRNTGSGFNLAGAPDPNVTKVHLQRITITDNLVININVPPYFIGDGRGLLIVDDPSDIIVAHNTILVPTSAAVIFGGPLETPPHHVVIRDNIMAAGGSGVKGPGIASGTSTIRAFMSDGSFVGNVLLIGSGAGYPDNNLYPNNIPVLGFVNANALDFRLLPNSPLRKRGSDGRDVGADVEAINAATAGVVTP